MTEFKPNLQLVELCLTYRCNIKCNNCSNLCTQAPFKGDLSVDSVVKFLYDIEGWEPKIGQITLHGGEPVLNPEIYDICRVLSNYRDRTGTNLWLLTNNSCDAIREKTTRILCDFEIPLGIATKDGGPILYIPVNESPFDLDEKPSLGCFQTSNCGICYNYLGYFPCSPMAAAARLFDYNAVESIRELTVDKCKEYFYVHCAHCGFAMQDRRRVTGQTSTDTWIEKFNSYQKGMG